MDIHMVFITMLCFFFNVFDHKTEEWQFRSYLKKLSD